MPAALVREVLWRASTLLMDAAPQFTRFSEADLVRWLNDAQAAVAKFIVQACSRVDSVKLVAGTKQSIASVAPADVKPATLAAPLLGTSLLDVVRNMGADGATPGRAVRLAEREALDAADPLWHTRTAAAVRTYSYDPATPGVFYVSPGVPTGTAVWLEIAWTTQPIAITAGGAKGSERYVPAGAGASDTITIGDEYVDDLVNYIVARANMAPVEWADGAKAIAFTQLFTGSINARGLALTGTNPNLKALPFAPDPIGRAK